MQLSLTNTQKQLVLMEALEILCERRIRGIDSPDEADDDWGVRRLIQDPLIVFEPRARFDDDRTERDAWLNATMRDNLSELEFDLLMLVAPVLRKLAYA